MKHVTYKGQHVDMEMIRFKNQHSVALGNANMNARGDILGRGGVIIKTREELLLERDVEMSKPDFNPVHNSASFAPEMEQLPDEIIAKMKKADIDFTSEDDAEFAVPDFVEVPEVQETPVVQEAEPEAPKRAPRKKAE